MDRKALDKLRLDRRLVGRRGFASAEELAKQEEALPDAAEKVMPRDGENAKQSDGSDPAGSEPGA